MPTYIDESGDTGRVVDGGKPYFRLAAVWTPSDDEVSRFQQAVSGLRRDLGLRVDYEFKFSRTADAYKRHAFFDLALSHDFRFAFSQIDKTNEEWRGADTPSHYRWCASDLAIALRSAYEREEALRRRPLHERVVVDDNRNPAFLTILKTQFTSLKSRIHTRQNGESLSLVKFVEFRKSHTDPWLQLVDMVCGAVGSHMDRGDPTWHDLISDRRVDELSRL